MRAALLGMLLCGCITGDDVAGAITGYCKSTVVHSCTDQSDCCDGFACAGGDCHKVTAGICLPIDAGTQGTGEACGCNADCASDSCASSTCS